MVAVVQGSKYITKTFQKRLHTLRKEDNIVLSNLFEKTKIFNENTRTMSAKEFIGAYKAADDRIKNLIRQEKPSLFQAIYNAITSRSVESIENDRVEIIRNRLNELQNIIQTMQDKRLFQSAGNLLAKAKSLIEITLPQKGLQTRLSSLDNSTEMENLNDLAPRQLNVYFGIVFNLLKKYDAAKKEFSELQKGLHLSESDEVALEFFQKSIKKIENDFDNFLKPKVNEFVIHSDNVLKLVEQMVRSDEFWQAQVDAKNNSRLTENLAVLTPEEEVELKKSADFGTYEVVCFIKYMLCHNDSSKWYFQYMPTIQYFTDNFRKKEGVIDDTAIADALDYFRPDVCQDAVGSSMASFVMALVSYEDTLQE